MTIIVFGSINMDLVARVPRLPAPGETLRGSDFFTAPGGKGANQAAACARLGTPTYMVGRVGEDAFGSSLRASLEESGVDVSLVTVTPSPSGVALIQVDSDGENSIVIIPGANGQIGPEDRTRLEAALPGADSLLLQLEIPLEAVTAAARMARSRGVRVILDPLANSQATRFQDLIRRHHRESADRILEAVFQDLARHTRGVRTEDDITLVVVKITRDGGRPAGGG